MAIHMLLSDVVTLLKTPHDLLYYTRNVKNPKLPYFYKRPLFVTVIYLVSLFLTQLF